MSLRRCPLAFLFLEATSIRTTRQFCEGFLGLPVIENRFHPPHDVHGVVKYDAGPMILALNKAPARFDAYGVEDLQILMRPIGESGEMGLIDEALDADGHRYGLAGPPPESANPRPGRHVIAKIWLEVDEVAESERFFGSVLDLAPAPGVESVSFSAGGLEIGIRKRSTQPPGPVRRDGTLLAFYCEDIRSTHEALVDRGVGFQGDIVYSEIGGSIRFEDPSGNRFCLYEPAAEALEWESGPKVLEIAKYSRTAA